MQIYIKYEPIANFSNILANDLLAAGMVTGQMLESHQLDLVKRLSLQFHSYIFY